MVLSQTATVPENASNFLTVRNREHFTTLEVEGALCAWEHMCESRDAPPFRQLFDDMGSAAMRSCAIQAGVIACHVYSHMEKRHFEFVDPYDWEFVPSVLSRLDWKQFLEDNQYHREPYLPDLDALLASMMAAAPERYENVWLRNAVKAAEQKWAYAGLLDDHPDLVEQAMRDGEDPTEFVKSLGEYYDLIPVEVFSYG